MTLKIPVVDRVPTYPGRVKLAPVPGQANTYDLTRADLPINEGTPINKALLDSKAYTLTKGVTVYVSTNGSDTDGDGSSAAPFATVQKAIDSIPKCLGGYHAVVNIAEGTYDERILIDGFFGGRLTVGVSGRAITLRGVYVVSSSAVRLAISNITYAPGFTGQGMYLNYDSAVTVLNDLSIDNGGVLEYGILLENGSLLTIPTFSLNVDGCTRAAIASSLGSLAALNKVTGTGNTNYGLSATFGGTITYASKTLTGEKGDLSNGGGRILTGGS